MSQGWLIAASADLATARELAVGFDLEVLDPAAFAEPGAVGDHLAGAENVGLVLSHAAARDHLFVALLRVLAGRLTNAHLIVTEPDAAHAFPFLPPWPVLALADARYRANEAARRRGGTVSPAPAMEPEATPEPAPQTDRDATPAGAVLGGYAASIEPPPTLREDIGAPQEPAPILSEDRDAEKKEEPQLAEENAPSQETGPFGSPDAPGAAEETAPEPPASLQAPEAPAAQAADGIGAAAGLKTYAWGRSLRAEASPTTSVRSAAAPRAQAVRAPIPADATAFAPKKLRRGTPELVRVAIHQPQDLSAVVRAAREADARAEPAPQSMGIGEIAVGASVAVSLDVRGAACDGALQRRTWTGASLDFAFAVEADEDAKQAVILARVFVDDAQIGIIAFTRNISGPAKKPASGDKARMKRYGRVFLSYSSQDRAIVAAIATAYERAGIAHFWDRTALKSGEEWSPRIRQEIDRCDLFHVCWSKAAAASEWVEKEAEHALARRRARKSPDITVQMLDGPPWAPHPRSLDAINFDDFVRAAVVGYARGEG